MPSRSFAICLYFLKEETDMALFLRDVYLEKLERTDLRSAEDYLRMRADKLNTDEALARYMGEIFWLLLCRDKIELTEPEVAVCRTNLSVLRQTAERAPKGALLPALAGHITERWPWLFADFEINAASAEEVMKFSEQRAERLFGKALLTDPRNPLAAALIYPRNDDGKRVLPRDIKKALLDSLSGESAIEYYLKNEIC